MAGALMAGTFVSPLGKTLRPAYEHRLDPGQFADDRRRANLLGQVLDMDSFKRWIT
jgi:hypothetical protein